MKKISIILMAVSAVVLLSCEQVIVEDVQPDVEAGKVTDPYGVLTKAESEQLSDLNTFAFSMLDKFGGKGESVVISPLSLSNLLGMLSEGASGRTRSEICTALGYGEDGQPELNAFCKSIIAKAACQSSLTPEIANVIIADHRFPILEQYKDSAQDYYSALVSNHDFDAEDIASIVNQWATVTTHGRIKHVVDKVNGQACFVNATYFRAMWKGGPFTVRQGLQFLGDGGARQVDMLFGIRDLYYAKCDGFSLVQIPYKDPDLVSENYRMTILLPDAGRRVDDLVVSLGGDSWREATLAPEKRPVKLTFPKFDISTDPDDIIEVMKSLGIERAFSPLADFSNLTSSGVQVGEFKHIANITVDEQGTEAAAVSYAGVRDISPAPDPDLVEFTADRPFVFAITEQATGAILFLGCYR